MSKTALVIRMSALGDVAMTIPAIYSFARSNPHIKVVVLTQPFFARLFLDKPENIELLAVEKSKMRGFKGFMSLLKQLNSMHITMVADLHNVLRSWLIDAFFRIKGVPVAIVDKQRRSRRAILRGDATSCTPFVERYFTVLNKLGNGAKVQFDKLQLQPMACDSTQMRIGVAPFARYENKIYSLELMHEAVRLLAARDYHVVLFGARGKEAEMLKSWEAINGVECVAGKFPIEQELQVMASLHAMISMDSANMHLASLVGTPVISVWGSTTPACGFLGWKQKSENAVVENLPCQPCTIAGSNRCKLHHSGRGAEFQCMKFSPEKIVAKVEQVVKNSRNK